MNKHHENMKNAPMVDVIGNAECVPSWSGQAPSHRVMPEWCPRSRAKAVHSEAQRREMKAMIGKSKNGKQSAAPQNCYPLPAIQNQHNSQLSTLPSQLPKRSTKPTHLDRSRSSFILHLSSIILIVADLLSSPKTKLNPSSFILPLSSLKALTLTLTLALSLTLPAQDVPTPAPPHKGAILLENATLHIGDGTPAQKGNLLVINDKIHTVGRTDSLPTDVLRIDLTGKHVYPGLIAPISQLGLTEIEAARATDDRSEVGQINPNARAIISYNTDSRVTPTVRSNGILLAQITPDGSLLKGMSSVVQLDAWSWEDAAYLTDDALHMEWPSQQITVYPGSPPREEQEKRLKERMQLIEGAMRDARGYAAAKAAGKVTETDLRWEAMVPVVNREKAIWITADAEKDIRTAIEFAQRHNLRMVLVGGADAWLLSDMLRQYQIPVVLGKPQSLPRTEDDPIDQPFNNARILYKAGVLTCLSMDNFWNYRNLPFQAGQVVAAGLTKEEALQLITANTAKILGIDSRTGTLAAGKDANIIVSTGDLLDMRSSNIEIALIQGRKIDLGNKQKDLNAKFLQKYGK